MNKKTTPLRCLLTALLLVVAMLMPTAASAAITPSEPTTGDGTSENPYQISTAAELYWFADKVNNDNANYSSKNAVLIADIDLEGSATNTWTPIGNTINQFKGTFDGGEHKITGLYISKSGNSKGLFGYLGSGGVIKNLGVDGSVHITGNNIGGVCGYNEGTITGCYNNGAVTGKGATGGVCGYNEGTMENCYNKGAVNGYDEVGGVCGHSEGTITNCYNTGNVIGTYRFTGGVCGRTGAKTTITCCYNTGAVTGTNNYIASTVIEGEDYSARGVGGICGYSRGGTISNSYNIGSVTGKKIVGGVCGYNTNSTGMSVIQKSKGVIQYCYSTGTISDEEPAGVTEQINAGGVCGKNDNSNSNAITNCYYLSVSDIFITKLNNLGTAISAEEFADSSKFSEWDFQTTWEMFLGRPTLRSVPEIEGKGTETEPYLIPDLATLEQLCNGVNAGRDYSGVYFTLTADIDMSGTYGQFLFNSWTPIGSAVNQFKGTFDGGGHKIIGLYTNGKTGFRGLFGYLGRGGVIKNLGVEGTVTDTNSDYGSVGGVCGYSAGTITGCYNKATVKGYTSVGGVCGHNSGTITSCYNNGDVSSTGSNMGGVCGMSTNTITGCYNIGSVTGKKIVGGVCGLNKSTLTRCYNTGTVSGTESNIGGVCGLNDSGTITSCYYLDGCNGEGTTFNDLGTAISAEDFVVEKTFVDWDFTNIWEMSWLGRPILSSNPETNLRGTCTETNPFIVPDLEMLELIYDEVNAGRDLSGVYFTMTADIDMSGKYNSGSGESWKPIGNESTHFKGDFDGGGHKITGLYINGTESYQGLFGCIGSGGTIRNLSVDGAVTGKSSVGGVCGANAGGLIFNCYNIGAVTGSIDVGGVCGWNDGSIISCYNTGTVTGTDSNIGGVCGINNGSNILSCYNIGAVTGSRDVGGVCGANYKNITRCYYDKDKCKVGGIGGSDKAGCAEGRSTAEFERGEVCYLLDNALPGIWGQHLGTDKYPIINSAYKILAMSKKIEDETYWATFSNWTSDVTISVPEKRTLKVFNVTVSGGALKLSRRSDDQVAMGEGVLLKSDDEYVNYKANETTALTPADYSVNNLVATPDNYRTNITADDGYTLYDLMYNDEDSYSGLGFYLGIAKSKTGVIISTDGSKITVTRGKAYLNAQTKEATLSSGVKVSSFVLSEEVSTGVEPVIVAEKDSGDDMYDLFGRKVINPVPGIYIKNGKKVFVK